jgi:glycosyltransferase involved in cell wall biosynthesis
MNQNNYIFITSLSLGGAEKIVSDQLYKDQDKSITLIVLYNKEKEHKIPKNVNLIRLNGKIINGLALFKTIAHNKDILVSHLASDDILKFFFKLNIHINLVIHNDKLGWKNSIDIINHTNISNIVVVSEHIKTQMNDITDKNIIVLKHFIYIKENDSEVNRVKFRKMLNIKENEFVIGMLGRVAPQKNYLKAISLFSKLTKNYSNLKLLIVGGYENKDKMLMNELYKEVNRLKLQNNVIFTGFIENGNKLISAFDAGFNSSNYEGLSIATQEMINYNIPIFLTDNSGQREIPDINNNLYFFNDDYTFIMDFHEMMLDRKIIDTKLSVDSKFNEDKESTMISRKKISQYSISLWSLLNRVKAKDNKDTLFITSNLNLGGAQRSLTNLLTKMEKDNYENNLIVLNESNFNEFQIELFKNGNSVTYLNKKDVFDISYSLFEEVSNYKNIVFWNVDSKIKLLVTKFFPSKRIYDVSPGDYCLEELASEFEFMLGVSTSEKEYFNGIRTFVSKYEIKRDSKTEYSNLFFNKMEVIPNGLYEPEHLRMFSFQPKKILVLGRIARSKYIKEIIEAFNIVNETHSDLSLTFYGSVGKHEEAYFNEIKPLLNNSLITLNSPIYDTQKVMIDYDMIIVLGKHQGSPNTVLEASNVGLPVLANNSGGTQYAMGKNGLLIPDNFSKKDLLEGLTEMIDNYQEYEKNGIKNIAGHQEKFNIDLFLSKYLELLNN